MKRYRSDIAAVIIIFLIVAAFFAHLLYPEPQLIVTPDYGRSDAFDRSFAMGHLVWKRISQRSLPIWTSQLAGGMPILGDSIGALYPPQIILNLLFESVTAYNLLLGGSVMLFCLGLYLWFRMLPVIPLSAFFGATSLTLSGIIIPRLTHGMIIPALALLPWILLTTLWFSKHPSVLRFVAWTYIVSLQVYTSFPQAAFISILFSGAYLLFLWRSSPLRTLLMGTAAILLTFGLSAAQLLPSWEFHQQSLVQNGFGATSATSFSFRAKDVLMMLTPFALGNPKYGTYTPFWQNGGDIFWENSGFFGLIPLFFLGYGLLRLTGMTKRTPAKPDIIFFFWGAALAFLLMLGKNSPLYFLHGIPPFSLFRTPSRYLWVFDISLMMIAVYSFDHIWRNTRTRFIRIILVVFALGNILHLFVTWQDYHLVEPASSWLTPPEVLRFINPNERIYTIGVDLTHNAVFTDSGWQQADVYDFLKNGMQANSNLVWSVPQSEAYSGIPLQRHQLIDTILQQDINTKQGIATISAIAKKVLDMSSVGTILSTLPVEGTGLILQTQLRHATHSMYVYTNPGKSPRAYFAQNIIPAETINDAYRALSSDAFVPGASAIVGHLPEVAEGNRQTSVTLTESADETRLTAQIQNNPAASLLVITDTYYPGWEADIDDSSTPLIPVNIRHRGVVVPAGDHTVHLRYVSGSLRLGSIITLVSVLITIGLTVIPFAFSVLHTRQITAARAAHPRHNRGRSLPRKTKVQA